MGISTTLIEFILGFAVLILLHELGHFLAARLFKIEVEEFGIGFPPRMVKLFEHGGTEFTLNWIPLGGFVRPKGENDPSVPGGLAAANPWARLVVLFAGPLMNILVGIILAIYLFYRIGDPITSQVIIRQVDPGSPAAEAGLMPDDQIIAVNGEDIGSSEELIEFIGMSLGKETNISYLRGEEEGTVTLIPRENPPANQGAIGIHMTNPTRPVSLGTAAVRGTSVVFENVRGILTLPFRLLSGNAQPGEGRLVGYKGMFDIYNNIQAPSYFFMAISISLGVLNLFPIPALDGGRILLTLPEILLRRRIPPQYENMIHLVGFTLLLLLIIYINIQDFLNPIQLTP
jgi:regulator of sigma E protease